MALLSAKSLLVNYDMTLDWVNLILHSGTELSVLKYTYMGRKVEGHIISVGLCLRKHFFLWSMLPSFPPPCPHTQKPNKKSQRTIQKKKKIPTTNLACKINLWEVYSVEIFKSTTWFKRYGLPGNLKICAFMLLKHIWYAYSYWILYIGSTGSLAQIEAQLWYIISPGLKYQLLA